MGSTWIVDGRIEVPRAALSAFQRTKVSPPSKAPRLLQGGDEDAVLVSALVKALAKQAGHAKWNGNVLEIGVLVADDSPLWLDWRAQLAALPGAAAAVKGSGKLAFVPAPDNGESTGIHVDGGSITELRGAKLRAAQKQAVSIFAQAADAIFDQLPFITEPKLRPIHAEVIRQLRAHPPKAVLAAAAKCRDKFFLKSGKQVTLKQAFTDPDALLGALERGDDRLDPGQGDYLAASALSILAELDAETALRVAKKIRQAVGRSKSGAEPSPVLGVADLIEANAASTKKDGSTSVASLLAELRKAIPKTAVYDTIFEIRDHPLVQQLRKNKSPEVIDAVRKALHDTLGGPVAGEKEWKPLTVQRAGYAAALLEILHAHPKERAKLKVAYATHPHYLVKDRQRAK